MKLIYTDNPSTEERKYLDDRLMEFNGDKIKGYAFNGFLYKMADDSGEIVAGIDCRTGGGWLEIVSLWVAENYRKKGLGSKLLLEAETTAEKKNCHSSYLYSYSFQAPSFYEKHGYRIFGELENYYENYSKFYLKKRFECTAFLSGKRV